MKNYLAITLLVLVFSANVSAQEPDMQMKMAPPTRPVTIMPGLGSLHHATSTTKPEAQRFFDQGLSLIFAFNHDESVRSFKRAAEIDPQMAMAWWGVALALGPNINQDVDLAHEEAAYDATQKALALVKDKPAAERDYIAALAKRYSLEPGTDLKKLAVNYKDAMGELSKTYPDDLDAATLYAESMMDLRPWQLWTPDGKPAEGTEEIVAVLESVLRRNPNHPGAIHYYIHAVEASLHPERALTYAPRLPQLMPMAGHLVHMPAHIYQRVGDYSAAARSNAEAASADEAFFKATGQRGVYSMYYIHNLDFLAVAHSMQGRYRDAIAAADKLVSFSRPRVKEMPMLEPVLAKSLLMMVRFNKWDEILKQPQPDASRRVTTAVWHFARAMAFEGKDITGEAGPEAFLQAEKSVPAEQMFGLNPASRVLKIAEYALQARIAKMTKRDPMIAIGFLRQGIEIEDSLAYDEPPAWFSPLREALGGALMMKGDFAAAEQVFRDDLVRNRLNGRSLFGLMESLKAQKKDYSMARAEFEKAWKTADEKLTQRDLWR